MDEKRAEIDNGNAQDIRSAADENADRPVDLAVQPSDASDR